ncbi:MAG: hypothetical protein JWR26_2875 [Pedosphaera sp.]|nr:hypothetical protein [Pedosphaera sp.]
MGVFAHGASQGYGRGGFNHRPRVLRDRDHIDHIPRVRDRDRRERGMKIMDEGLRCESGVGVGVFLGVGRGACARPLSRHISPGLGVSRSVSPFSDLFFCPCGLPPWCLHTGASTRGTMGAGKTGVLADSHRGNRGEFNHRERRDHIDRMETRMKTLDLTGGRGENGGVCARVLAHRGDWPNATRCDANRWRKSTIPQTEPIRQSGPITKKIEVAPLFRHDFQHVRCRVIRGQRHFIWIFRPRWTSRYRKLLQGPSGFFLHKGPS